MKDDVSKNSLAADIAERIAQHIIKGDLLEGERIQELKLAKELDVSRGTVREALLLLARSHLIYIYPRRGAVVAEISAQQVKHLFEAFAMLLGVLMQRYSVLWRGDDMAQQQQVELQLQLHSKQMDVIAFYDEFFVFLAHVVATVNNEYTSQMFEELTPGLRRCYFLILNIPRIELEESHQLILHLLQAVALRKHNIAEESVQEFTLHLCRLVLTSFMRMKQIELAWAKRSKKGTH